MNHLKVKLLLVLMPSSLPGYPYLPVGVLPATLASIIALPPGPFLFDCASFTGRDPPPSWELGQPGQFATGSLCLIDIDALD